MRKLRSRRVADICVLDPDRPDVLAQAAERLVVWAREWGLEDGQWLGYMRGDPEIAAYRDCRYEVAVEMEAAEPDGEVGVLEFPAMQVAKVELSGAIDLEMRALDWMFGTWLPASGYVLTELPCFEAWRGLPFAHGVEHFELLAQIPVEPG